MRTHHRSAFCGFTTRRVVASLAAVCVVTGTAAAWWFTRHSDGEPALVSETDREKSGSAYQPPSSEGYVGSETCARCHAEIAETFKTHPMSRSITRVDPTAEDATVPRSKTLIAGNQRVYDVEIHDDVMVHHERMFDADGELIYDQGHAVDYVVGSGRRAKAYLHQKGDLLFMSPLNWYSQTQKWDMAPSYTPDDPRRFSRRVTDDCLACHAGRIAAVGRSLNKYETPAFHEMAIGCENCHGPGASHVAWHESGRTSAGSTDPIVNPARLTPDERESVCYQCHLIAEVRLPRYGRSELDFRPGQRLSEIWTVLDEGSEVTSEGKTKSVNHVQQMRDSRCFLESDGRFGCISCHDPHRAPAESERITFYRTRCLNCHGEADCSSPRAERDKQNDSCIACHMPGRESSNISHVTQTDHRVRRVPDDPSSDTATTGTKPLVFFNHMDERLPDWEHDRAVALAAWVQLNQSEKPLSPETARRLLDVVEKAPDDGTSLSVLGAIAARNGLTDRAVSYYERARKLPASEEAALSALLDLYYASSDFPNALECADRLIEIDPYDVKAWTLRADALALTGRQDEGITSAEKALDLNPTLIAVREWLVKAYAAVGRTDDREEQERLLRRMRNARPPR
ncbi:MAG: tetratricopeptide repeat protein [Planctomycetaceae bacterium]